MMSPTHELKRNYVVYKGLTSYKMDYSIVNVDNIIAHTNEFPTLSEGLFGKVKPYVDIDITHISKQHQINNELDYLKQSIQAVSEFFKTDNLIVLTANGYKSSTNSYITSIHIIVNDGSSYKSGAELKVALQNFNHPLIKLDMNVYASHGKRQLFRMLGSSKPNENRPFRLTKIVEDKIIKIPWSSITPKMFCETMISLENDNDIQPNEPIQSNDNKWWNMFIEKQPTEASPFNFSHVNGSTIHCKRIRPSHCDICNRIHDTDNTLCLYAFEENDCVKLLRSCTRSPKQTVFIWTNEKPGKINQKKMKHELLKKATLQYLQRKFKKEIKYMNLNVIEFNERYCSNASKISEVMSNDRQGIVVLKSNMGSGKTFTHSKSVSSISSVGIITYRKSIAEDSKRNNYSDYIMYLESNETQTIQSAPKWICQLDSLHKILTKERTRINDWMFEHISIDEAKQVMNHLTSHTYMKQRSFARNWKAFQFIIQNTRKLVLMDANITAECIQFYKDIRDKRRSNVANDPKTILFWNKYSDSNLNIRITEKSESIIEFLKNDLKNNKPFYLACNGSIEKIKGLKRQLLSHDSTKKIIVICSDTQCDKDVEELMLNHELIKNYDGIICSPSIQGGVSFDEKNYIHSIYGMFSNCTNTSGDSCQMLRRIRYPINPTMTVGISINKHNVPLTTSVAVSKYILSNCKIDSHIDSACGGEYNENGIWEIQQNEFFLLYCNNTAANNLDTQFYVRNFIKHIVGYGMKIKYLDMDKHVDLIKENRCELKLNVNKIKSEYNLKLAKSQDISQIEYDDLHTKDQSTLTETKLNQMRRYIIKNIYGMKNENLTEIWFSTYNNTTRMQIYGNLSCYYSSNIERPLSESLYDIGIKEASDYKYIKIGNDGGCESTINQAVTLLRKKIRYQKHSIIVDWLSMLGIKSFSKDSELNIDVDWSSENIHNRLEDIHYKYIRDSNKMKRSYSILGKKVPKLAIKSNDHAHILKIINGSLKSELGTTIKKIKKHSDTYSMFNSIDKIGGFQNPYSECDNEENCPVLGSKLKYGKVHDDPIQVTPMMAADIKQVLEGV